MNRWSQDEHDAIQAWLAAQRVMHTVWQVCGQSSPCVCGICRPVAGDQALEWADAQAEIRVLTQQEQRVYLPHYTGNPLPIFNGYRPIFRRGSKSFELRMLAFAEELLFPAHSTTALLAFLYPASQFGYLSRGANFLLCDGGTPRVSGKIVQPLNFLVHAREHWQKSGGETEARCKSLLGRFDGREAWLPLEWFEHFMPWLAKDTLLDPAFWSNDRQENLFAPLWLDAGWRVELVDAHDGVVFFRRA